MTTDAPQAQTDRYQCPVCLWKSLNYPYRRSNFDICPCCQNQFGLSDAGPEPPEIYHIELREHWLKSGGKWWLSQFADKHPDMDPSTFEPIPEFVEGQLGQ